MAHLGACFLLPGWLALLASATVASAASDAFALVQHLLSPISLDGGSTEEVAVVPRKFHVGTNLDVAVKAGDGVSLLRCSITGLGAEPDTYDVHLLDVAPAFRNVAAVPQELLQEGGAGRVIPTSLQALASHVPEGRRALVEASLASLMKSAEAPRDPIRQAEAEAAAQREAAKAAAHQARVEAEQAREAVRQKKLGALGHIFSSFRGRSKHGKASAGKETTSFDSLDRNGDGIVTREEYHEGASVPAAPPSVAPTLARTPTLAPEEQRRQQLKLWEHRAKDWEGRCQAQDRSQLWQWLEVLGEEQATDLVMRLPNECASQRLNEGSRGIHYEELIPCMQKLTNTSASCSTCPVKFMLSVASGCQQRCEPLLSGCRGIQACRTRGAPCLECMRQPAMKLLRCADVPRAAEMERQLANLRFTERGTLDSLSDVFAKLVGGSGAVLRVQTYARSVQRLVSAWALDPQGLDALATPLLEALSVKSEADLRAAVASGEGESSALITADDVAKYDTDGNGHLEAEELERALAGMGTASNISSGSAASTATVGTQKQPTEASRKRAARKAAGATRRAEEAAKLKVLEDARRVAEEARQIAEANARKAVEEAAEEARQKAEEEAQGAAKEARLKAEEDRRKADEDARKAAEEARLKAEEEERARLKAEADEREAAEQARLKAEEDARRAVEQAKLDAKRAEEARLKAREDARRAAEEERLRDPKQRAQDDAWHQALEEEAERAAEERATQQAEEQAKLKAVEAARVEAEEAKKRAADEEARRAEQEKLRVEEEAKRRAADEEAEQEERIRAAEEEEAKRRADEEAQGGTVKDAGSITEEASGSSTEQERTGAIEEAVQKSRSELEAERRMSEEAKKQPEGEAATGVEQEARSQAEAEAAQKDEEARRAAEATREVEDEAAVDAKALAEETRQDGEAVASADDSSIAGEEDIS